MKTGKFERKQSRLRRAGEELRERGAKIRTVLSCTLICGIVSIASKAEIGRGWGPEFKKRAKNGRRNRTTVQPEAIQVFDRVFEEGRVRDKEVEQVAVEAS